MKYRALIQGSVSGEVVVLEEPLSMWGGFDPRTGLVIDASHPQLGVELSGRVVSMPSGRGSSSASTVLAESMRVGTSPSALILARPDPILVIGSLVGTHLYGVQCPILVGPPPAADRIRIDGGVVQSL